LHGVEVVDVTLVMIVPAADVLSCKVTVPATFDPMMIRRTTPAPVFSKDPVAVLNHVKELPPPGRLFGESVTTEAVSLAVGAVLAAFTAAVFVPSVIR
jgi:hypothetical protein